MRNAKIEANRNGLLSVFDNCSDEQKWLIDELCFRQIDDSFFRYVSPQSFIATIEYWLTDSLILNESFGLERQSKIQAFRLPQLCSKWLELLTDVVQCEYIYVTNEREKRSTSFSVVLSDLFLQRTSELSCSAKKVSNTVRLLSFLSIRHYFRKIETKKIKYKEIVPRVKELGKFVRLVDDYLCYDQENISLVTLHDVVSLSERFIKQKIDRNFFARNLRETFDEEIVFYPGTSLPDSSAEREDSVTHSLLNELGESPNLPVDLRKKDAIEDNRIKTINADTLESSEFQSSLTSKKFTKPNFIDYQRKPEYALHLARLNYALTDTEKKVLVSQLLRDIKSDEHSRVAMVLLLEMLTSSSLKKLSTFIVTTRFENKFMNSICINSGMWRRHSLVFEDSLTPRENQLAWLSPHDRFLQISLPPIVIAKLRQLTLKAANNEFELAEGIGLYRILDLDVPDLNSSLNAYLNELKKLLRYGFRTLTHKSIRYALYSDIAHDVDASAASLLFASFEFSNPVTLYYLSLSELALQGYFDKAVTSLGFSASTVKASRDIFIGSQICVDMQYLSARIRDKINGLKVLLDGPCESVALAIKLHNDFANMVSLSFALVGALREQAEYLFDYATVSESDGFMSICDKYHRGVSPTRIIPLSDLPKSLLREYKRQLRITSHALRNSDPKLAQLLFSLYQPARNGSEELLYAHSGAPLLGLILEGSWHPISSKSLIKFLGDDFDLPPNFIRHVTCSQMPVKLVKYRQVIMGHSNQGHHSLDQMSTSLSWLADEKVIQAFDAMLLSFGIMELKAQSLRGAYSVERLPKAPTYYPKGYIERKIHSDRACRFASKHFKALLIKGHSPEHNRAFVKDLPRDLIEPSSGARLNALVDKYYASWQKAYEKSENPRSVKRLITLQSKESVIALQVVEYNSYVKQLQIHFLNSIANNKISKSTNSAFFISLALYQPRIVMQLIETRKIITFTIKRYQNTFLLEAGKEGSTRISSPINWLSSFLFMQMNSAETLSIGRTEIDKALKSWLGIARQTTVIGLPVFSSIKGLCRFISDNGLNTQSRLSASASRDARAAGDYALEDLGRLLKHSSGHLYKDQDISNQHTLEEVRKRKLLTAINHKNYDAKREETFVEELSNMLKQMQDTALVISVKKEVFNLFSEYVGEKVKSIDHVCEMGHKCSEFLILCIVYCLRISQRLSPINKGRNIQAATVQNYLNTVVVHLQKALENNSFLLGDEDYFENLYSLAIKGSKYEKKSDVYDRLKDFHVEMDKEFVVDVPDWRKIKGQFESNKNRKIGIARLLAMSDYERAKEYIKYLTSNGVQPLSEFESDMHILIMALAFRVGLRKREIRNLQVKHINIENKIISITATRYLVTKSINSPRRIDISLSLDDEEWGSLTRIVQHAEQKGGNVHSRPLFGSGSLVLKLFSIDKIIFNIMLICRKLSGNANLRFYDLRHSHINYSIMLVAKLYEDKRYETTIARWARCKPESLTLFREARVQQLIGGQAEVGGILVYGLARELGHSHITERQYYIHILNLIDDGIVNVTLSKQLPQTLLFEKLKNLLHLGKGGFRPEQSIRTSIKNMNHLSLAKKPKVLFNAMPPFYPVFTRKFIFESRFMQIHHCLIMCWQLRGDSKQQRLIVDEAALPSRVWNELGEQLEIRAYQGIYLPTCLGKTIDYKHSTVDSALRYVSTESFNSMLSVLLTMFLDKPSELLEFLSFYLEHQHGDEIIVTAIEKPAVEDLFAPFDQLEIKFVTTRSPFYKRGRNTIYYKLQIMSRTSSRKSHNAKFNFLVHITNAAIQGFDI